MNCSTPGLPVHHQLPDFTQTHALQVSDAIQPSHPLSSPSPPAPSPSQHQGLFQWVNSSHQVAKVLEFQLQHQSFQWTPRSDLLKFAQICGVYGVNNATQKVLFSVYNSSAMTHSSPGNHVFNVHHPNHEELCLFYVRLHLARFLVHNRFLILNWMTWYRLNDWMNEWVNERSSFNTRIC